MLNSSIFSQKMDIVEELQKNKRITQIDKRELGNDIKLISFQFNTKLPLTNIDFLDLIQIDNIVENISKDNKIKWSVVKSQTSDFIILLLFHPDHIFNGQSFYSLIGSKSRSRKTFENSFHDIQTCFKNEIANVLVTKEDLFCFGEEIYYMMKITMTDTIFMVDCEIFLQELKSCLENFGLTIKNLKFINEPQLQSNAFFVLLCLKREIQQCEIPLNVIQNKRDCKSEDIKSNDIRKIEKNMSNCKIKDIKSDDIQKILGKDEIYEKDNLRNLEIKDEQIEIGDKTKRKEWWKETTLTILQLTSIAIFSGATAIWGYNLL